MTAKSNSKRNDQQGGFQERPLWKFIFLASLLKYANIWCSCNISTRSIPVPGSLPMLTKMPGDRYHLHCKQDASHKALKANWVGSYQLLQTEKEDAENTWEGIMCGKRFPLLFPPSLWHREIFSKKAWIKKRKAREKEQDALYLNFSDNFSNLAHHFTEAKKKKEKKDYL